MISRSILKMLAHILILNAGLIMIAAAESWSLPVVNTHFMGNNSGIGSGTWPPSSAFPSSVDFIFRRTPGDNGTFWTSAACSAIGFGRGVRGGGDSPGLGVVFCAALGTLRPRIEMARHGTGRKRIGRPATTRQLCGDSRTSRGHLRPTSHLRLFELRWRSKQS